MRAHSIECVIVCVSVFVSLHICVYVSCMVDFFNKKCVCFIIVFQLVSSKIRLPSIC